MLLSSRTMPVEIHGNGRFVLPARHFTPVYLRTYEEGLLRAKVEEALDALRSCTLCPRDCRIDRLANRFAVCKAGRYARVASHFHHFGEEDVLRGWRGSGTIFFSWCNLRCVFCFEPQTRIFTDRGMERIADLFASGTDELEQNGGTIRRASGIRVWTRQGRLAPASKVFRHSYRGEMIVLKPHGLPQFMITPDHKIFAVLLPDGEVHKVPAGEITQSHLLVVPKPRLLGSELGIDAHALLLPCIGSFRRSKRRKISDTDLRELIGAGAASRLTSRQLGQHLGYHPAYVRRLRTRVRHGQIDSDAEFQRNDLVEKHGRIRFKTEKGVGIPRYLHLTEDLARLLGYYCAEGHVVSFCNRPNSHRLILSFGRHERRLAEHTRELLRKVFGVNATLYDRHTTITVEAGKSSLALLFRSLCGTGARDKRVPAQLFVANAEIVRAFLGAYWDGDGCRLPPYLAINTVSHELALGVAALLLRAGIFPYFYATVRPADQRIAGRSIRQSETLYNVKCRIEAWDGSATTGRLRHKETSDAFWAPVQSISRIWYNGPVYNIEVADEDHSYTANGIAVANCQNFETSQIGEGKEVSPTNLARMMLQLQEEGCHNINFVTPEHVVPQILEALLLAVGQGLRLPLVYNTSSYDSAHSIRLMEGVVDIYMPDFKLWDRERSRRYLLAPDYPEAARRVIQAMHDQVGELTVNEDGLALRGVIVRHLVMPGILDDTREIMRFLAGLSGDTYVNVMDQYYPAYRAKTEEKFRDINRRVAPEEMKEAYAQARAAGLWRFDTRWRRGPVAAWD